MAPHVEVGGMTFDEPEIAIEGTALSVGQSMAVRVAVSSFLLELQDEEMARGLGEKLADGYRARLTEVARLMAKGSRRP
ncbi:MAG: hypothetical protein ACRD68_00045 [Pyrinomonadaceae bacterium]